LSIAFVGEEDYIKAFSGFGIKVFPAENAQSAEKIIETLDEQGFSLVFVSEQYAEKMTGKTENIVTSGRMNVCVIPGKGEGKGIAREMIRNFTIKATGTDPGEKK